MRNRKVEGEDEVERKAGVPLLFVATLTVTLARGSDT
jgi:hypothetical protein